MSTKIQVAIVDDHQSIIDGYRFRLQDAADIEVVGTAYFGEEIEPLLANHQVDVLLLDAQIPVSSSDRSTYPVFLLLPKLLDSYPDLHVLIISMHSQRSFVKFALEAGASGYVVKDDFQAVESLEAVIRSITSGGIHFSRQALQPLLDNQVDEELLTQRQLQALSLAAAYPNETTAELAIRLAVAHSTMRNLLSGAYMRLGVRTRSAAVTEARRREITLIPE